MSLSAVFTLISLLFSRSVYSTYNEKPNFVILFADDLGFNDVDWRGTTNIYTPNLASLRNNNAIELNRFYVTPKCSPTRASLMTGRYTYNIGMQHDVGIIEFFTCGLEPSLGNTFWTTRLKTCSGYNNYYMGKWHLVCNNVYNLFYLKSITHIAIQQRERFVTFKQYFVK